MPITCRGRKALPNETKIRTHVILVAFLMLKLVFVLVICE